MKYTNSWHLLGNEKVLSELNTDMYKGLSSEEVKKRRQRRGANNVWHIAHRSAGEIAVATLFDLATLLLIISAASAALFERSYEAGMIAAILVIAGVVRTVTYVRANRIFEDMAREKIPLATVIRNGAILVVSATETVEGDILFFEAGDTVPCDARVISGDDAIVSERGITGNKTPVHKFNTVINTSPDSGEVPCEFRSNILFAGSRVLSGSVRAVAVACGERTLISMKGGGIEVKPTEDIPAVVRLSRRSKTTSLIMLACVLVLTAAAIFFRNGVKIPDVFLSSMAMAVAAMSEFLTAIGYIIVAVTLRDASDGKTDGVRKDGENREKHPTASRISIKDPEKLDLIAKPDVVVFCGSRFFKSGRMEISAYRAKGAYADFPSGEKTNLRPLQELLSLASAATAESRSGVVIGKTDSHTTDTSRMVSRACEAFQRECGTAVRRPYAIVDHSGAGERHFGLDCSIVEAGGKIRLVVCGALDEVMRCCTDAETAHGREKLTPETKRTIFTECARLEFSGARVIAVAKTPVDSTVLEPAVMTYGMTFAGFFALSQENEKTTASDIRTNVGFLRGSGIIPVLLTENPDGDLYYCHRFGLFNKKTVRIRAGEIDSLNTDSLTEDGLIVSFADIGGVYLTSAYEKTVKLLRGEGDEKRTVITLGMDMWDTGALKESDVGAAVTSTEYRSVPQVLARNASVTVKPEENTTEAGFGGFSGLVSGIKYARRAVENIDSAKIFITASQIARLVMIFTSVFTKIPLLSSVFILIWGLLFDFAAALVMAFENNGRRDGYVREKFCRKREIDYDTPIYRRNTFVSLVLGAVWGIAATASVPAAYLLAPVLGYTYSPAIGASVLAASVILSGTVFALETMKRDSIFVSHNPNPAQLFYILASVLFAAGIMLTEVFSRLAGGEMCFSAAPVALIPAIFILLVSETAKLVQKFTKR